MNLKVDRLERDDQLSNWILGWISSVGCVRGSDNSRFRHDPLILSFTRVLDMRKYFDIFCYTCARIKKIKLNEINSRLSWKITSIPISLYDFFTWSKWEKTTYEIQVYLKRSNSSFPEHVCNILYKVYCLFLLHSKSSKDELIPQSYSY